MNNAMHGGVDRQSICYTGRRRWGLWSTPAMPAGIDITVATCRYSVSRCRPAPQPTDCSAGMDKQGPAYQGTAAQPAGKPRIAIATSSREPAVSKDLRARTDLLAAALRSRGVSAEGAVWNNPDVNWSMYDMILVTNVWDYNLQPEHFKDWLWNLHAEDILICNHIETILWNMNKKTYLTDLQRHGANIIDTVFVKSRDLSGDDIFDIMKRKGWTEAVVKPCVGADSLQVTKVQMADLNSNPETSCSHVDFAALIDLAEDAMVQEYLPNIRSEGECSLVYFGTSLSHMVWKIPSEGNFRLGQDYDYVVERNIQLDIEEAGKKVIKALKKMGVQFNYARVDFVRNSSGIPSLMELELIEPYLYLGSTKWAPEILADSIVQKLGHISPQYCALVTPTAASGIYE